MERFTITLSFMTESGAALFHRQMMKLIESGGKPTLLTGEIMGIVSTDLVSMSAVEITHAPKEEDEGWKPDYGMPDPV